MEKSIYVQNQPTQCPKWKKYRKRLFAGAVPEKIRTYWPELFQQMKVPKPVSANKNLFS